MIWKKYCSYEDVREVRACVYLHAWAGRAYYVGKLGRSWFGGRYGPSYRHWIDGCLEHGAELYVATLPDDNDRSVLDAVESALIDKLRPLKNIRKPGIESDLYLHHVGDIPEQLRE